MIGFALGHLLTLRCSVFTRETEPNWTQLIGKLSNNNKLQLALTSIKMSSSDVFEVLSHLNVNKACGPDGICPRLLKEGATELSTSLSDIFNKSVRDRVLPVDCTSVNITSILKKETGILLVIIGQLA